MPKASGVGRVLVTWAQSGVARTVVSSKVPNTSLLAASSPSLLSAHKTRTKRVLFCWLMRTSFFITYRKFNLAFYVGEMCSLYIYLSDISYCSCNFQRWMSWLEHRWRAQRSVMSIVNCRIPWINSNLNVHCAFGISLKACLLQSLRYLLPVIFPASKCGGITAHACVSRCLLLGWSIGSCSA